MIFTVPDDGAIGFGGTAWHHMLPAEAREAQAQAPGSVKALLRGQIDELLALADFMPPPTYFTGSVGGPGASYSVTTNGTLLVISMIRVETIDWVARVESFAFHKTDKSFKIRIRALTVQFIQGVISPSTSNLRLTEAQGVLDKLLSADLRICI